MPWEGYKHLLTRCAARHWLWGIYQWKKTIGIFPGQGMIIAKRFLRWTFNSHRIFCPNCFEWILNCFLPVSLTADMTGSDTAHIWYLKREILSCLNLICFSGALKFSNHRTKPQSDFASEHCILCLAEKPEAWCSHDVLFMQ